MSANLQGKSINKAFDDAMEHLGGIKGIADALGLSESHVRKIRVGLYKLKLEHAVKIERETIGKVKAADLGAGIKWVGASLNDDGTINFKEAFLSEGDEI